jgi:flagellar basal-body rod protein FlgG
MPQEPRAPTDHPGCMLEGLDSAAAGMAAQQQRLDSIANDLANANTAGYKHGRVGFRDLLYDQAGPSAATGVRTGHGAAALDAGRSFAQGALQRTDRSLDVAIQGDGFLAVRLPDGRQGLTRDGGLHVDGLRRIVTNTGNVVQPQTTIPKGVGEDAVQIGRDGTVTAAGRRVGRLALVTVRSPQQLLSVGGNAFVATAASGAVTGAPRSTSLTAGALEMSNVDVAEAMVEMIDSQRAYELQSKAIHTADEMLQTANEVRK